MDKDKFFLRNLQPVQSFFSGSNMAICHFKNGLQTIQKIGHLIIRGRVIHINNTSDKCIMLLQDRDNILQLVINTPKLISNSEQAQEYYKHHNITINSVINVHGSIMKSSNIIIESTFPNVSMFCNQIDIISSGTDSLGVVVNYLQTKFGYNDKIYQKKSCKEHLQIECSNMLTHNIRTFLANSNCHEIYTAKYLTHLFSQDHRKKEEIEEDNIKNAFPTTHSNTILQLCGQVAINSGEGMVYSIGYKNKSIHLDDKSDECVMINVEMEIMDTHTEIINFMYQMFTYILSTDPITSICAISTNQFIHKYNNLMQNDNAKPSIKIAQSPIIIDYVDAVEILRKSKYGCVKPENLDVIDKMNLSSIIKEKYNTDLFAIDKFPSDITTFNTAPVNTQEYTKYTTIKKKKENPLTQELKDTFGEYGHLSLSYEMIFCGTVIATGSQKINNEHLLKDNCKYHYGSNISIIKPLLQSFQYGSPPHGGFCFSLENMVSVFMSVYCANCK